MPDCSEKSKFKNNSDYICNPKSGRYVTRTGIIGKKLFKKFSKRSVRRSVRKRSKKSSKRSVRRSVRSSDIKHKSKAIRSVITGTPPLIGEFSKVDDFLYTLGKVELLGKGGFGVGYLLSSLNRVVKLIYTKTKGFEMSKKHRNEINMQIKGSVSKYVPDVYDVYYVKIGSKYALVIEMEMAGQHPYEEKDIWKTICSSDKQNELVDAYKSLSKTGVYINDDNVLNVLYSKPQKQFYLIDFGLAQEDTVTNAWKHNLSVIITVMLEISGRGLRSKSSWRCTDLNPMAKRLIKEIRNIKNPVLVLGKGKNKLKIDIRNKLWMSFARQVITKGIVTQKVLQDMQDLALDAYDDRDRLETKGNVMDLNMDIAKRLK